MHDVKAKRSGGKGKKRELVFEYAGKSQTLDPSNLESVRSFRMALTDRLYRRYGVAAADELIHYAPPQSEQPTVTTGTIMDVHTDVRREAVDTAATVTGTIRRDDPDKTAFVQETFQRRYQDEQPYNHSGAARDVRAEGGWTLPPADRTGEGHGARAGEGALIPPAVERA